MTRWTAIVAAVAASRILAAAAAASRATFAPTAARTWTVEYGPTYKLLNITTAASGTSLFVLSQNGSAAPTLSGAWAAAPVMTVPVTRAALLSATEIQYAEVSAAAAAE